MKKMFLTLLNSY